MQVSNMALIAVNWRELNLSAQKNMAFQYKLCQDVQPAPGNQDENSHDPSSSSNHASHFSFSPVGCMLFPSMNRQSPWSPAQLASVLPLRHVSALGPGSRNSGVSQTPSWMTMQVSPAFPFTHVFAPTCTSGATAALSMSPLSQSR